MSCDPRDARIAELEAEVAELRRMLAELRRELEEWKRGHRARSRRGRRERSGLQPAGEKKRPGRKPGHEGAQRAAPPAADREEPHERQDCDCGCRGKLVPTGESREHAVERIIPARREVVKHITFEYRCAKCGKVVWSELPPELGPNPLLDPSVVAFAASLRFDFRLSYHAVSRFLEQHAGLTVTPSGIFQMLARAAERTAPAYDDILCRARKGWFVHADETNWFEDGERMWAWVLSHPRFSFFHIDASRGHKVIEKLLCRVDGEGNVIRPYLGIVVSDFMGAYETCRWMMHQYCWSHLIRDARKEAELDPCPATHTFHDRLVAIYHDAQDAQRTYDLAQQHGIRVRLGRLAADEELQRHPDVARLQKRVHVNFQRLLNFLDLPGLPANNNQAERDTRPLVIFRHISFGTRSPHGSDVHARWMSLTQTAHKQGVDLGHWLHASLAAHHTGNPIPSLFSRALRC